MSLSGSDITIMSADECCERGGPYRLTQADAERRARKIIRRSSANDRSFAPFRAYGYWYVQSTDTEYLFDRRYSPMIGRDRGNRTALRAVPAGKWIEGITFTGYFFDDFEEIDLPHHTVFELFTRGKDVTGLFLNALGERP